MVDRVETGEGEDGRLAGMEAEAEAAAAVDAPQVVEVGEKESWWWCCRKEGEEEGKGGGWRAFFNEIVKLPQH